MEGNSSLSCNPLQKTTIKMEKTILNAFEKDGVVYPPVEAEHANCFYSESRITGFDFGGEVIRCYCYFIDEFVDGEPVCKNHGLNLSTLIEDQLEQLEIVGEFGDSDEMIAKRAEVEEFLAL